MVFRCTCIWSAVRCIRWKDNDTALPDNLYDSGYHIAPVLPAPILKTVPESFDPLRQTKSDIRQGRNNRAPAFSESDKPHPQPLPEDTAPTMLYNRSVLLRSRSIHFLVLTRSGIPARRIAAVFPWCSVPLGRYSAPAGKCRQTNASYEGHDKPETVIVPIPDLSAGVHFPTIAEASPDICRFPETQHAVECLYKTPLFPERRSKC